MRLLASTLAVLGLAVAGATARAAEPRDATGDAGTAALNLLETHGYTDIKQFGRAGDHFEAVVERNGHPVTVTVDPATGVVRQHS